MMMMPFPCSEFNPQPRRVRVLIVDDNPQVIKDLRQLLELSGVVEVAGEAADGVEATRMATTLVPEVALVDLEMPGMDGYEVTAKIKSSQPTLRVVILSVHAGPGEMERAFACGADGFVVKGAEYQVLINALLGMDRPTQTKK